MDFCSPNHNAFHVPHCVLCQKALAAQFAREEGYIAEIYRLERLEEGIT